MINRKTKRAIASLASFVTIQLDQVLWEFAKLYRKELTIEYPDREEFSEEFVAFAMLLSFEKFGHASRHSDPAGKNVTFKATPKFLRSTGLEAGSLITIRGEGQVYAGSGPLRQN